MQGDSNSWALDSEVLTFVLKAAADQDRGGNVQAKAACFRVVRDSTEAGSHFSVWRGTLVELSTPQDHGTDNMT